MSELVEVQAEPQSSGNMVAMMERMALNPNVDVAKLEKLYELAERVNSRKAETEFQSAMAIVQSDCKQVATDANNPQTRSRYASYAAIDAVLRPVYSAQGFAVSFDTEPASPEMITMILRLMHRGGHCQTYRITMPADGKGAKGGDVMTKTHATGAAMSYGMRYLLKMAFNVAVGEYDNDGNDEVALVNQDQAATLEALIQDVGANKAQFLKYLKVESIEKIPEASYASAVSALNAKRKAKK